jgi:metallo-beta-lactamase family protein
MGSSIEFLGGAGTVTGSKFLLHLNARKILVDCGLFQGLKELRLQNWSPFPVPPKEIDAVLLTHAHLDHCGYLPILVREGFRGPIYATAPTRELSKVILIDSAKIQEEDAERANREGYSKHKPARPLYTSEEAKFSLGQFRTIAPDQWLPLFESIQVRFSNAGHILGSSIIEIKTPSFTIAFTGDLGRQDPLILHPPKTLEPVDYLVVESTYGDRLHSPLSPLKELSEIVRETVDRKGHLIIPAFAVGRTQDVLYLLSVLRRQSQIPSIPIFLDSPMGIEATEIFSDYPEWHRLPPSELKELVRDVTAVKHPQQSEELQHRRESSIVIAGSGMLTGGRVLSHLLNRLSSERNTVLLVGFQAPSTRGSLLRSGIPELKIFGQYVPVRAQIRELSTLSAHGDQRDLLNWIEQIGAPPKKTFIVHGEPQAANALRVRMKDLLSWDAVVPHQNARFEL